MNNRKPITIRMHPDVHKKLRFFAAKYSLEIDKKLTIGDAVEALVAIAEKLQSTKCSELLLENEFLNNRGSL